MLDPHLFDSAQSGRLATMGRLQGLTASKSVSLPRTFGNSATFNRFARNQSINRSSEARIRTKSPNQVASLSCTAAGLLRAFLHAVGKPPASRKSLRRQGKAPPFNHCCPLAPSLSRGKTSSQRRAARNARLSQSVFRYTPHRQPQTRRMESLRYTTLSVLSGLDVSVSPCLHLRRLSRQRLPPPARPARKKTCKYVRLFDYPCKLPYTALPRINHIKTVACRGLRPCRLYYL